MSPAWLKAREILEKGQLGRVRRAFISWRVETFAHRTNQHTWKRDAGGGVLNLFVSHSFDSVEWMFGRVRRLAAHLEPATGADARAEVWLELVDGRTSRFLQPRTWQAGLDIASRSMATTVLSFSRTPRTTTSPGSH